MKISIINRNQVAINTHNPGLVEVVCSVKLGTTQAQIRKACAGMPVVVGHNARENRRVIIRRYLDQANLLA